MDLVDTEQELNDTIHDLREAKAKLNEIQEKFKNEPILLKVYSDSAEVMVQRLESHLAYVLSKVTSTEFIVMHNEPVDFWIRIQGKKFHDGKAPINVLGSYLQKLNTAMRQSSMLVRNTFDEFRNVDFYPSFDLAETAKGSLKLGLKQEVISEEQMNLIEPDLENKKQKLATEALNVMFKTLATAEDEDLFKELLERYGEEGVIKLIHYTEELTPSNRADIDEISFEGSGLTFIKKLSANKETRNLLKQRAKNLRQGKEFVVGKAAIRAYTIDQEKEYYRLTASHFHYNGKNRYNLEIRISKSLMPISADEVYGKILDVSGFLHYNQKNNPDYLEIDHLNVTESEDDLFE